MAQTESNLFTTGQQAPDFLLPNTVDDKITTLAQLKGEKGTVIMFICNHCPFVIHVNDQLVEMGNEYMKEGINFIAISSNDIITHPDDAPFYMKQVALNLKYPFPYLYDETQEVAKAYNAACTPDFYVFDAHLKSVYHGQLDDSRPDNGIPVTGSDVRNSMNLLLKGEVNSTFQKPSMGCSIKWK